jgi:hypothetical protein
VALPEKRIFLQCANCGHEMVFHRKHREALAKRLGKVQAELTAKDVQPRSAMSMRGPAPDPV